MKVLLRQYLGEYYVWKKAEYKNGYYNVDGFDYNEADIVAIKDSDNANYVVCNYCGEKILDNPESIESHFAKKESEKNCMMCRNCRPGNSSNKETSVRQNDDGTYCVTETINTNYLLCSNTWKDIDHQYTKTSCIHSQCRRYGTAPYGGILMKYPDLFETQITNDLLLKKKYEYSSEADNRFMYDLKCRKTLFAAVNERGIVEYFMCHYQYRTTFFFYSAKYNKLLYRNNGKYNEGKPDWMSQTKYDQIASRIRGLYKGVKVDE